MRSTLRVSAARRANVKVTYSGSPTHVVGLYVSRFVARDGRSGPSCQAPDPSDRILLQVAEEGAVIYQCTLSQLADSHAQPGSILHLSGRHGLFHQCPTAMRRE